VLAVSSLSGQGIGHFWAEVLRFERTMREAGEFEARRRNQAQDWMWHLIDERLLHDFRAHPAVARALPEMIEAVAAGRLAPAVAAERLLALAAAGPGVR
jgi:LAO/AO transport system kinase